MTSRNPDLKTLIIDAWEKALARTTGGGSPAGESAGQTNRDRSGAWVDCLGRGFQEHYHDQGQVVFWRQNDSNRGEFGLNELLFDVSVCQVEEVLSIEHETPLPFVSKCHWEVESELDDANSREITKDFSKLVMGLSDNKLFISSYQATRQEQILNMCSGIARHCTGKLYMCFIDHPRNWGEGPDGPVVFQWDGGRWNQL